MKNSRWVKLGALVIVIAVIGWGLKALGIDVTQVNPERIREFVLSFGIWAPVVYVLAYGQPIVPVPGSIMTIAGGLVFGTAWGICWLHCAEQRFGRVVSSS